MFSFLIPYYSAIRSAAIAALLTAAVAFWIHHNHVQQDIGEAKVVAADKAAAAKQAVADKERIDATSRSLAALQANLDRALSTPIVHDVVRTIRVCDESASPAGSSVRPDAASREGSDAAVQPATVVERSSEAARTDVTDETESEFSAAGARIEYLQGYILKCQENGFCQKELP